MIDTLKRNVVQNQLTPPQQQMGAQPQAQGAMPPQQGQPKPNPHLQTIDALQKQKGQLQKQYQNISPASNMLGNAAESILNAQPGESAMRTLARGFLGASSGLRGAGEQQQENLRQQAEIDRAIANTHQYIEDYQYKRMIDREEMNMRQREVSVKERSAATDEMKALNEMRMSGNKSNMEQTKLFEKDREGQESKYNTAKTLLGEVEQLKADLSQMKPWNSFEGAVLGKSANALALATNNDADKVTVFKKRIEDLVNKLAEKFGANSKLTNQIMAQIKEGKVSLGMGSNAINTILDYMQTNLTDEVGRTSFAQDAMRNGIPSGVAERGWDEWKNNPDKFRSAEEATLYVLEQSQNRFRQEPQRKEPSKQTEVNGNPEQRKIAPNYSPSANTNTLENEAKSRAEKLMQRGR